MAQLYLIRHAKPEGAGTFLGQADPPLAPGALDGVSQTLSALPVEVAYLSPLRRARETASCLRCANVIILPELREICFGQWTGKPWREIEAQWPVLAHQKLQNWLDITSPGGETWPDFQTRVRMAWNRIRQGPFPAAIVAHVAVNGALSQFLTGFPASRFTQGYGEIVEVGYDGD
jgi:broad specificity phosphatase PhoE